MQTALLTKRLSLVKSWRGTGLSLACKCEIQTRLSHYTNCYTAAWEVPLPARSVLRCVSVSVLFAYEARVERRGPGASTPSTCTQTFSQNNHNTSYATVK